MFKKVLRVFQLRLRGVSSSLLCVLEILMLFNKLSKKFEGSFKRISRKFQGYFKIVSSAFQRRFKGVSMEISIGFKVISKKLKEISGKFQIYFKEV